MAEVTGAHLYLRISGPGRVHLEETVQKHQLGGQVSFLEPVRVEQLAEAATEFDVGVSVACPDSANGRFVLGYKFFENMAAGLAAVCPSSHVLGPFLARHPIGSAFRGCQPDAIAGAFRYCVAHPEEVALWKQRARALAEGEFNARVQGARLRSVVEEMLGS